jgi:hypothetical protein
MRHAASCLLLLGFLVLNHGAFSPSLEAQARYDPRLQFRTVSTPRFDIHFHQGEEAAAARLAVMVEEVAAEIDARLGPPRGRVHVILVDQTDLANGWATIVPYNLIELAAAAPAPRSLIGNTDDWLRLVFAHEYTHVVHLERSRGWARALRQVLGRNAALFPNAYLPGWQVEGIATFEESMVTGRGRLPAGDFRMLIEEAAREGRFEPLDRVAGGVVDWPSGAIPYLYGAYFHEYLADRFGAESLARLTDDTAGRLPFLGARSFRRVFGEPLGTLWADFAAQTGARVRARAGAEADRRTRLTSHGFRVAMPAFAAGGRLFYSVANPHGFPAVMELGEDGRPHHVATRSGGERLSASGDLIVFDELEILRNAAILSDLHAVNVRTGARRRLTREARASDPDVAPDGLTIVATVQAADRRWLATMTMPAEGELTEPAPLVSEAGTDFTAPRWSPDGRTIAAERWRLHGPSEIVLVDVATREVRPVVASARGRNISPAWLPDGRTLLFSSDRDGDGFRLHATDVLTGATWRVAGAGLGAQSAVLSPDGTRLVFVGYSADGYDLYSIPFGEAEWTEVAGILEPDPTALQALSDPHGASDPGPGGGARQAVPSPGAPQGPAGDRRTAPPALESRAYRPWPTLTPRFWSPVIEAGDGRLFVGAATAGADALGRHGYAVSGGWSSREVPEWAVGYSYARWRPVLFAGAADETDGWLDGQVRTRSANAGVLFPVRKLRWRTSALVALYAAREQFACPACAPPVDLTRSRHALRGGWSVTNARAFGYSISPEEGGHASVTLELTRRALGSVGDAGAATVDVRGYLRAFPRHGVVAGRVAAAAAWGDPAIRRAFSASGSGPPFAGFGFGSDAIGLMRGFAEGDIAGQHAIVANLDYRFPLAWIQRGAGTAPVFLRNVHGAVFADVGHAWGAEGFRAADLRRSLGAELSFGMVLGYWLPVTVTGGAAWRDDPRAGRDGWAAYGRLGWAF